MSPGKGIIYISNRELTKNHIEVFRSVKGPWPYMANRHIVLSLEVLPGRALKNSGDVLRLMSFQGYFALDFSGQGLEISVKRQKFPKIPEILWESV